MNPRLTHPARVFKIIVAGLALVISGSSAGILFQADFEAPVTTGYEEGVTPLSWIASEEGFGSGRHGKINADSGDYAAPAGNEQAYAFRYSNSGITTAVGVLGPPLALGGGYEVSFDVVRDEGGSDPGTPYSVSLVAFPDGVSRTDCRRLPDGSVLLASISGDAPSDGSFATHSFSFSPSVTHAALVGMDLGIRIRGATRSAAIDNVTFSAIAGSSSDFGIVATDPADDATGVLAYEPLRVIFSQEIVAGTGNIILRNLTDPLDPIDTVIPVTDPRVEISGVLMTVRPGPSFEWNRDFALLIHEGALVANGASFVGITDVAELNFSTAADDPLFYAPARLKDHINGAITLTEVEIEAHKLELDRMKPRFSESASSIATLFDLVETYDDVVGPLWVNKTFPRRSSVKNDLKWTIFKVMQGIMDEIYSAENIADHEGLLAGYKFGSSANFPGAVDPPADPNNTHVATINGSFPASFGRDTLGWTLPARKPTGCYLAPGTIVTITVPPALVGQGYQVRIGAHSWDMSERPSILRLDRATLLYDLDATSIKVASPYGGGIYIEVPFLADAGIVEVEITGAVRSPYFSAKDFHRTTLEEWRTVERNHDAPYADFQSEKFMMQVPTKWIYALSDPATLMADWDAAMDVMNDLMGYPRDRGKETMYPQVDLLFRSSVHAPGYPSTNTSDNPNRDRGGNHSHYLVRDPRGAKDYEFHEQGHAYLFPKFDGETESTVNLHHVAVMNRAFGVDFDQAFADSRGYGNNPNRTLDHTAVAWMCVFNFAPRERPMATAEKAYQLKGHAKFVDIARLFGWAGLDAFWSSFNEDLENGTSSPVSTDEKLLRLCQSVGQDIRPLFHFWGIHPSDPASLAASVDAEGLVPSVEIYDLLVRYQSLVPANNEEFRTFAQDWWDKKPSINGNWTEREHARQWDTEELFGAGDQQRPDGEIYAESSAISIESRVQDLVDLYFPGGRPAADYGVWAAQWPGLDLSDPLADHDGDGRNNNDERLFGLDPTRASSVDPITLPLTATGSFDYTRRHESLTGLRYSVWTSTTLELESWTEDLEATQNSVFGAEGVQIVSVNLSADLQVLPRLFVQVRVD